MNSTLFDKIIEFLVNQQMGLIGFATAIVIGRSFGDFITSISSYVISILPLHIENIYISSVIQNLLSFLIIVSIVFIFMEFIFYKIIVGDKITHEMRKLDVKYIDVTKIKNGNGNEHGNGNGNEHGNGNGNEHGNGNGNGNGQGNGNGNGNRNRNENENFNFNF